ncbi:hypothetical protein DFH28DRAFT_891561 [Melampsora americana]|nr:hypothetical protein DFH28DRAFT_891561 [Melampsora americana]
MSKPFLGALDPLKPLPPISFRPKRQLTGIICQSPQCINRKPHSTTYFQPKNQPNGPLVGISVRLSYFLAPLKATYMCPFGGYCRSYFKNIYQQALNSHNQLLCGDKKRKRDQIEQDQDLAMELHNLLNEEDAEAAAFLPLQTHIYSDHLPLTPASQPKAPKVGTRLISAGQCNGHLGRTADGHAARARGNIMCPIKACFKCCNNLYDGNPTCVPHAAQAKGKLKKRYVPTLSSTQININSNSNTQTNSQAVQITHPDTTLRNRQGGGETYRRVANEADTFRSLGIQHQADERRENEEIEKVNNTVTIVVWANSADDPVECEIWREYIPNWPRFALNQSEDLKEIIERELGTVSNQRLQIWSPDEKTWIGLRLNIIEMYPEDCSRILIRFPNVDSSKCQGLAQQKGLVSSQQHKPDLCIAPLIQPDEDCPPLPHSLQPSLAPSGTQTPPSSPLHSSLSSSPEIQILQYRQSSHSNTSSSGSPEIQMVGNENMHDNRITKAKWPTNVSMVSMLRFLDLSNGNGSAKLNIPNAWHKVFGDQGWTFVFATVSLYRRWLNVCDSNNEVHMFVKSNPQSLIHDAIDKFGSPGKTSGAKKEPQVKQEDKAPAQSTSKFKRSRK